MTDFERSLIIFDRAGYAVIYNKLGSIWVEHEVLTLGDGPSANFQTTQTYTTNSRQSSTPDFSGYGFGICFSISGRLAMVDSVVPFQSSRLLLFRGGEGLGIQLKCRFSYPTQTAHTQPAVAVATDIC